MSTRHFLICSTLAALAAAQLGSGLDGGAPGTSIGDSIFSGSYMCNRTFADANITGVFSFDPEILQGQQTLQPDNPGLLSDPVHWAATLYQGDQSNSSATTELSLWYSSNGANYSNNFKLGYDACYFWMTTPSVNSYARGQTDAGDCLTMFDADCVGAMQALGDQFAIDLVGQPSPGPDSNLTTNSLPTVCGDMATLLTENFPASCKPYFTNTTQVYGGPPALGGALTGNQSLVERSACTFNDSSYSLMWSQYGPANNFTYNLAYYLVAPLMTVFMPIADVNRPETLGYAKSVMSCVRANHINEGSQDVPAAPSPTPVTTSQISASTSTATSSPVDTGDSSSHGGGGGLSGGAIAGIVIGAVLGVALIAGLVLFFLFRKRLQSSRQRRQDRKNSVEADGGHMGPPEWKEASGHDILEAPNMERHEMHNTERLPPQELSGHFDQGTFSEKPRDDLQSARVELDGTSSR